MDIDWISIPGFDVISTLRSGASPPEFSFVVLFMAIGLYMLIGRFFYDAWRRARTVYGLTNTRILIVQPSKCKSLNLAAISEINLQLKHGGRGSIVFGPELGFFDQRGSSVWWGGAPAVPTFELIGEAEHVYAAIRDAQKPRQPLQ
jgi:hypothetical protein